MRQERKYNTKPNSTSFKKGHKKIGGFVKGSKHTEIAKQLIGDCVKGKIEGNSRNWKGGISPQHKRRIAPRPMPDECEICEIHKSKCVKGLHYDHCHKTGKFRGWLCIRCNAALGMVKDNIEVLEKLITYLKNNE